MNQNDIDTFLTEQKKFHAEHLSAIRSGVIGGDAPTFNQWLAALYLELKEASETAQSILKFGLEQGER
jgi:hypothetical protein